MIRNESLSGAGRETPWARKCSGRLSAGAVSLPSGDGSDIMGDGMGLDDRSPGDVLGPRAKVNGSSRGLGREFYSYTTRLLLQSCLVESV